MEEKKNKKQIKNCFIKRQSDIKQDNLAILKSIEAKAGSSTLDSESYMVFEVVLWAFASV